MERNSNKERGCKSRRKSEVIFTKGIGIPRSGETLAGSIMKDWKHPEMHPGQRIAVHTMALVPYGVACGSVS